MAAELPDWTPCVRRRTLTLDSVDGVQPDVCARVDSPDAVAAALAICHRLGAVVVPRGGGTHLGLGMPPARVDVLLDLCGLSEVIEYRPEDLTLAVAAGARLQAVQRLLADAGQMLALDPAGGAASTVGGMVAANLSGPRRAGSGTARDLVIGLEVAGLDGLVTRSGGMVVKNVTGYDLPKAHIGALGTLGVITRVNLKITPRPAVERTLVVPLADPAAAGSAVGAVIDCPLMGSGFDLVQRSLTPDIDLGSGAPWLLAIRVPGTAGGVAAQLHMAAAAVASHAAAEGVTLDGPAQTRFWSDADALARPPASIGGQTTCPPERALQPDALAAGQRGGDWREPGFAHRRQRACAERRGSCARSRVGRCRRVDVVRTTPAGGSGAVGRRPGDRVRARAGQA